MQARNRGDGSIILVKGSPNWQCRFYDLSGRKISISSKTSDRNKALKFLAREVRRVRDEGLATSSDAKRLTYGDMRRSLLASYSELGNKSLRTDAEGDEYICGLPVLDKFFNYSENWDGPKAVFITTEKLREFIRQRQEEEVGSAAINGSMRLMRRMFKIALLKEKKITTMPFIPMLKEPPARKGFTNREDFRVLLSFLPTHLKPLILFLYTTGVRQGEAQQIEWWQVDLDSRVIRLQGDQTKNSEARTVPIVSELCMLLREIKKEDGLVFSATNLRREWIDACTLAGLGTKIEVPGKKYDPRYEGLTLHDLRRSAARNLITLAKKPEKVAMEIGGWKTRAMLDRYHIVAEEDVQSAGAALDALVDRNGRNLLSSGNGSKMGKVERFRKSHRAAKQHKH